MGNWRFSGLLTASLWTEMIKKASQDLGRKMALSHPSQAAHSSSEVICTAQSSNLDTIFGVCPPPPGLSSHHGFPCPVWVPGALANAMLLKSAVGRKLVGLGLR